MKTIDPNTPRRALLLIVGAALLLAVGVIAGGCRTPRPARVTPQTARHQPAPLAQPVRAIWVARYHYHFPEDIRTIMRNCAALGANTVLWQVRGAGAVAYPSRIEPWSEEYGFRDPGFDPLAVAVDAAHENGLRVEAWINAMPGWRGVRPPATKSQLYHAHPEWFLHDESGGQQPLYTTDPRTGRKRSFYVILNPCLPQVRRHITSVIAEIVDNYDVDGVHLDYIRYAWETTPNARDLYPRDPQTLDLYARQTGKHPDDDARAWDDWRANQLTQVVADIRDMLDARRPGTPLTAATWSSPARGYRDYFQNSLAWLRTGLVDAVYPMAYTDDAATFTGYIEEYTAQSAAGLVIPGIGLYKLDEPQPLAEQFERCTAYGGNAALFSYESLFATAGDRGSDGNARISPETVRLRQMRREVVGQFFGGQ